VKATKIMFLWLAATNFSPSVAAFVADSYMGRFLAIGLGSILSFLVTSFLLNFQLMVLFHYTLISLIYLF